jgi:hypothetical protein
LNSFPPPLPEKFQQESFFHFHIHVHGVYIIFTFLRSFPPPPPSHWYQTPQVCHLKLFFTSMKCKGSL